VLTVLSAASAAALAMLALALVLNVYRLLRGPTAPTGSRRWTPPTSTPSPCSCCSGIVRDSSLYFEAALLIALLGFIGTVALCKFVLRGDVVE
jgi:multicomponent K+:H+ antiporter subunit F